MDFEKVTQAIEESRPEIKDLLFSPEIGRVLQSLAETHSLEEETSLKLVDEVGYIILGLKEQATLKDSLSRIGVPEKAAPSIIQEINGKIFTELDKIKNIPQQPVETTPVEPAQQEKQVPPEEKASEGPVIITKETKREVMESLKRRMGTSTEPMHKDLPMVERGEEVHDVAPAPATPVAEVKKEEAVVSKPEEPKVEVKTRPDEHSKPETPITEHRYPGGKDPYREPLV